MTNLLKSVKHTATIDLPFITRGSVINSIQFTTDGGGDVLKIKYRDNREVWVWADDGVNVFCDTAVGFEDMLEGAAPKQAAVFSKGTVFRKSVRVCKVYGKQKVAGRSYRHLNRTPSYRFNEQRIISDERDYKLVYVEHGYISDAVKVTVVDGNDDEIELSIKYMLDSDVITVDDGKTVVHFKADGVKRFPVI